MTVTDNIVEPIDNIVELLRNGHPPLCEKCIEWGWCSHGLDDYKSKDCEDGLCPPSCPCSEPCSCWCHGWAILVKEAADKIERLREQNTILFDALRAVTKGKAVYFMDSSGRTIKTDAQNSWMEIPND